VCVCHTPNVLVEQGATTAVLPPNPLQRAVVYCVIASPGKGEPFAPTVVTMRNATTRVPVHYLDRRPQVWANTGEVCVFSDQIALISCTELVKRERGRDLRCCTVTGIQTGGALKL
jgi:hypothetical protein